VTAAAFLSNDSQLILDRCLARLRVDAGLDVDPTIDLLPVEVIVDVELDDDDTMDVDDSELAISCTSMTDIPSAAEIVRSSVRAGPASQRDVPTLRRIRTASAMPMSKYARWPVVLCALVATYFGATAFLMSPLGAKPEVREVVKASRGHISGAFKTTKSLVRL
jgi:hypothetical protein